MNIEEFFKENPEVAIAFSGGVDSAYLLYAAKKYAKKVKAYYVKSCFQPQFELDDAIRLNSQLGCDMEILNVDILKFEDVKVNPVNRCYYCKIKIFEEIKKAALKDGFEVLLDGTNASDEEGDRPGMKALRELKVLSPLRICGLSKNKIRDLSKEAGLFTWDKPAYACLATRVPSNTELTATIIKNTEIAEGMLFDLGFTDFRIRYLNGSAKIQVPKAQIERLITMREEIVANLKPYYKEILLDLEGR
ncbi:MAG: ATP-dependent sacrificial sulfur transferase LarE [Clostridia bacterium]|nr:ATP-dependent sacrificial sulfur transferase LarE [Clostridia bacterium]